MSAKKRVFDKDLGVELVLDDEIEESANITRKEQDDQADGLSRKRAKFDSSHSSTNPRNLINQIEQPPVSNVINQASSRTEQKECPKESELQEDSDNENYEDIDYGDDDDDDDDFNSDLHHDEKQSSEDSKSQHTIPYEDDEPYFSDDRSRRDDEDDDQPGDMEEDDGDVDRERERCRDGEKEQTEKCKYWPSCNAGDECSYYHPTKPCRAFPNCRFGKKCLYIHPPCRFNPNCTRPACPFAHPMGPNSTKNQGPGHFKPVQQPLAPQCKYGFNCMYLMCKFSHQRSEPCRFGANCLLETCTYTHPSDVARKKPASAFKWSAQS